eukprot:210913_1
MSQSDRLSLDEFSYPVSDISEIWCELINELGEDASNRSTNLDGQCGMYLDYASTESDLPSIPPSKKRVPPPQNKHNQYINYFGEDEKTVTRITKSMKMK